MTLIEFHLSEFFREDWKTYIIFLYNDDEYDFARSTVLTLDFFGYYSYEPKAIF